MRTRPWWGRRFFARLDQGRHPLPIFLATLGLFAIYWNQLGAFGLGIVWIIGRLLAVGYMADPAKRSTGFLMQFVASAALLRGVLGKIVYSLATGGV